MSSSGIIAFEDGGDNIVFQQSPAPAARNASIVSVLSEFVFESYYITNYIGNPSPPPDVLSQSIPPFDCTLWYVGTGVQFPGVGTGKAYPPPFQNNEIINPPVNPTIVLTNGVWGGTLSNPVTASPVTGEGPNAVFAQYLFNSGASASFTYPETLIAAGNWISGLTGTGPSGFAASISIGDFKFDFNADTGWTGQNVVNNQNLNGQWTAQVSYTLDSLSKFSMNLSGMTSPQPPPSSPGPGGTVSIAGNQI